jgi:hypothetical protein
MAALTGGQKLQAYLNGMARNLATAGDGPNVRVGFLENAVNTKGQLIAPYAAANEFGTRHIPPRPFFRSMIRQSSPGWGDTMAKTLTATKFNASRTLSAMGEVIVGQLRQSIVDTNAPPLAPATIRAKGFDKPLIETGDMFQSADYEVST